MADFADPPNRSKPHRGRITEWNKVNTKWGEYIEGQFLDHPSIYHGQTSMLVAHDEDTGEIETEYSRYRLVTDGLLSRTDGKTLRQSRPPTEVTTVVSLPPQTSVTPPRGAGGRSLPRGSVALNISPSIIGPNQFSQPRTPAQTGVSIGDGISDGGAPPTAAASQTIGATQLDPIQQSAANILALAILLQQLARDRIEVLRGANDPDTIERNRGELDLLATIADGLAHIIEALQEYADDPQPFFLGRVGEIANNLTEELKKWWEDHKGEAINLSFMGLVTYMMNLAGADMHIMTGTIVATIGGPKAFQALRSFQKRRRRKGRNNDSNHSASPRR